MILMACKKAKDKEINIEKRDLELNEKKIWKNY